MKETDDTYAVLRQRAETAERKVKAYEDAVGSLRGDFEEIASSRSRLDMRTPVELMLTARQMSETLKVLRSDNHRLKTLLEQPGLKYIVCNYEIYSKKSDPKRNLLLAIVEAFCMDHYTPDLFYHSAYTQFHMHTLSNITGAAAANLYSPQEKLFLLSLMHEKLIEKTRDSDRTHYLDSEKVRLIVERQVDFQKMLDPQEIALGVIFAIDEMSVGQVRGVVGADWKSGSFVGAPNMHNQTSMKALVNEKMRIVGTALDLRKALETRGLFFYRESAASLRDALFEIVNKQLPDALHEANSRLCNVKTKLESIQGTIEKQKCLVKRPTPNQLGAELARRNQVEHIVDKIRQGHKMSALVLVLLIQLDGEIRHLRQDDLLAFIDMSELPRDFRMLLGRVIVWAARVEVELFAASIPPAAYLQTLTATDTQNMRSDLLACSGISAATQEGTRATILEGMKAMHAANPSGPPVLGLVSDGGNVSVLDKPFEDGVCTSFRALYNESQAQTTSEITSLGKIDSLDTLATFMSLAISTTRIPQYFKCALAGQSLLPPPLYHILELLCKQTPFCEPRPRVKAAKRTNSTALKNLKKDFLRASYCPRLRKRVVHQCGFSDADSKT
ncbi:hypothetical protein HDU98_011212 [Podochytrium sp. JEL0797]|nr:hypothetical protein HDU98_011212 [Podochytrium sp. JEL0797]